MAQRRHNPYGEFGGPNELIESYIEWRDTILEQQELGLVEADTRADFAEFLFGPVSTSLWHGYQVVQAQWRRYARSESLSDFRPRRLRGLNGLRGIGYVGEHGEYPAMRRTIRPAAILVIDTYGGVYALTRHLIINDESGDLLNRNPRDMGQEMGRFVSETLIALVESNPTAADGQPFYSGARGNEILLPLSEDSLADAITWMENQLDEDGRKITISPAALAVKTAKMQMIARRVLYSEFTGAQGVAATPGTAAMEKGTLNPLEGIMPRDAVIREPYLTDANNWYLFADPATVPAFAVGFLNGREEPFIGLKNPEVRNALGAGEDPYTFELDSVDFKVRHDFGSAAVDPRGAFRSVVT